MWCLQLNSYTVAMQVTLLTEDELYRKSHLLEDSQQLASQSLQVAGAALIPIQLASVLLALFAIKTSPPPFLLISPSTKSVSPDPVALPGDVSRSIWGWFDRYNGAIQSLLQDKLMMSISARQISEVTLSRSFQKPELPSLRGR